MKSAPAAPEGREKCRATSLPSSLMPRESGWRWGCWRSCNADEQDPTSGWEEEQGAQLHTWIPSMAMALSVLCPQNQ